jgi:hypothetical protein
MWSASDMGTKPAIFQKDSCIIIADATTHHERGGIRGMIPYRQDLRPDRLIENAR